MTANIIAQKMVFGGDCIAKIDGKTVFVPYAVPGENLDVEITEDAGDFFRAKIIKINEASPHRVTPPCPYYMKCGGCTMMHIESTFQEKLRTEMIYDAFNREHVEVPKIEVIKAESLGYRARFQLNGGGFMKAKSNDVIPVTKCLCATDEMNKYLAEVPFEERPKGRIHVFASDKIASIPDGFDKIIIADEPASGAKKNFKKAQKAQRFTENGRLMPKQKKIAERFEGSVINPHNRCSVKLGGKTIDYDVQGFFQSNLDVLEKALPYVTEGLSGKNALDVYAGCGTLSVFLSDIFENVCLVEHNKSAVVYAEQNLAGKKHVSFGLSGEVFFKYHADGFIKQHGEFDAVIIDPPRSGMEKEVCSWLCKNRVKKIRSISCNAATFARDAAKLINAGYRMTRLFLLDFYPQTSQIETLAWFEG